MGCDSGAILLLPVTNAILSIFQLRELADDDMFLEGRFYVAGDLEMEWLSAPHCVLIAGATLFTLLWPVGYLAVLFTPRYGLLPAAHKRGELFQPQRVDGAADGAAEQLVLVPHERAQHLEPFIKPYEPAAVGRPQEQTEKR